MNHAAVHLLGERQAESAAFSPLGLHHQERSGRQRLDAAVKKKVIHVDEHAIVHQLGKGPRWPG